MALENELMSYNNKILILISRKLVSFGTIAFIIASSAVIFALTRVSKFPKYHELIDRAIVVVVAKNTADGFVVNEVLFREEGSENEYKLGARVTMLGDSRWAGRADGPREVVVILWRDPKSSGVGRDEIPILEDGRLAFSGRTKAELTRDVNTRFSQSEPHKPTKAR